MRWRAEGSDTPLRGRTGTVVRVLDHLPAHLGAEAGEDPRSRQRAADRIRPGGHTALTCERSQRGNYSDRPPRRRRLHSSKVAGSLLLEDRP
jgi:hypothetical protein